MSTKKKKSKEEYSMLSFILTGYDFNIMAGVNSQARLPKNISLDEKVYKFTSQLGLEASCIGPEECAGEPYRFNIYGEEDESNRLDTTMKDCHRRDAHGAPVYRKVRGLSIPVFNLPEGVGMIENYRRKSQCRLGWVWVKHWVVSDLLAVMHKFDPLYIMVDQHKVGRERWIVDLSVQTENPLEE